MTINRSPARRRTGCRTPRTAPTRLPAYEVPSVRSSVPHGPTLYTPHASAVEPKVGGDCLSPEPLQIASAEVLIGRYERSNRIAPGAATALVALTVLTDVSDGSASHSDTLSDGRLAATDDAPKPTASPVATIKALTWTGAGGKWSCLRESNPGPTHYEWVPGCETGAPGSHFAAWLALLGAGCCWLLTAVRGHLGDTVATSGALS